MATLEARKRNPWFALSDPNARIISLGYINDPVEREAAKDRARAEHLASGDPRDLYFTSRWIEETDNPAILNRYLDVSPA